MWGHSSQQNATQRKALTSTWPCWHLDLEHLAFRTMRNKCVLGFQSPCLLYFCTRNPNGLPLIFMDYTSPGCLGFLRYPLIKIKVGHKTNVSIILQFCKRCLPYCLRSSQRRSVIIEIEIYGLLIHRLWWSWELISRLLSVIYFSTILW